MKEMENRSLCETKSLDGTKGLDDKESFSDAKSLNVTNSLDDILTEESKYHDILHLPAPKSKKHPPMPLSNRAAQFAPFSALVGHKDVIKEAARSTGQRVELEADAIAKLNEKFTMIQEGHWKHSEVIITCFVPDEKKEGGAYAKKEGMVKKINQGEGYIVMEDGTCILLKDILGIDITQ